MALVFRAAQVKQLDQGLLEQGLLEVTVENAGRSVAQAVHARHPRAHVLVVAGKGFNGADGLVAARHLLALNHTVTVLHSEGADVASLQKLQAFMEPAVLDPDRLEHALYQADVVVDGLLGTGFRPPLSPSYQQAIAQINACGKPVFSIDLPSGLQADVPVQPELAVQATVTLALAGFKPSLLFEPTNAWAGEVEVLSIGVPESHMARFTQVRTLEASVVRSWLPVRTSNAHKGSAGEVWVLGGQPGMTGCVALSTLAALRTGSGLVRYSSTTDIPGVPLESIAHPLQNWDDATALPFKGAIAVGMGLGEQAAQVAVQVLAQHHPTVVDADALQPLLAGQGHDQTVFTPHPGEAARMLGTHTAEVLKDPLEAARVLQREYGGVVVLKGGPTVVATPQGKWINTTGNPGMASAGMGDTLAGVIASLLGQGLEATQAALAGVYLHGLAGDLCYKQHHYGLQASDVGHTISQAWKHLTE